MKIRKAIIPVAGFGTRFLPATKAQPKEMLPLVDKPVIQYLVEEAVAAGIEEIIFVTGRGKRAIEDHFDHSFELEHNLVEKGKDDLLKKVREISQLAKFVYVRQNKQLGDGHAVLCAKQIVNKEPCAVLFGDDIVVSKVPCLKQLMNVYDKRAASVVALEEVPKNEVDKYGVVKIRGCSQTAYSRRQKTERNLEIKKLRNCATGFISADSRPSDLTGGQQTAGKKQERLYEIEGVVEKPSVKEAPSNLIIVGKYIITPGVFDILEELEADKSGEIRLADALSKLAKKDKLYGYEFNGIRYDCGNKLGFLKATVDFGLKHPEVGKEFRQFLVEQRMDTN